MGWVYTSSSPSCSSILRDSNTVHICDESGVYTSVYVVNDTQEQSIGWGRGFNSAGTDGPLPPQTIVVSEAIANALGIKEGSDVILQIQLE